jgi:hypothetical protein
MLKNKVTHLATEITRPLLVRFEFLSDDGEVYLMSGKTWE